MRLKVGQQLSPADIAHLKEKDQAEVAYDRALKFLSYRPRSTAEVQRRLMEKGYDVSTIEQVTDRLTRAGLLDDVAFARYWIENRDTFKPRSHRALRYELRRKGVADAVISDLLDDHDEEDASYRAARARVKKLTRRYKDTETVRSKLLAFLSRRGFSYYTARETVDKLLAEMGEEGAQP
jgi:regulatory protein